MPPSSREYNHSGQLSSHSSRMLSSSHPRSHGANLHRSSSSRANPMSINYLLNPSHTPSLSTHPTPSTSPRPSPSPPLSPSEKLLREKRRIQSEKKRQWRKNLTPEQKLRRQILDAQRKREQRMNQTEDQRSKAKLKDAARKSARRAQNKKQKLRAQEIARERQQTQHRAPDHSSFRVSDGHSLNNAFQLGHSIDKILNTVNK